MLTAFGRGRFCLVKGTSVWICYRIMIQVQSTWFPIIDRNPQKFVPNIFEAKESDFQAATQRVYRSKMRPSSVILPMIQ